MSSPHNKPTFDYVSLGDSFTWGFADLYAAHIEANLGRRVILHNQSVGGQRSDELLDALRGNDEIRAQLCKAKVVTFMIPMAHFKEPSIAYVRGVSEGIENEDGMHKAFALYQRDANEIFKELLFMRSPAEAIIRTMDCYLPPFLFNEWERQGVYPILKSWWNKFNGCVTALASKHQIPLACVNLAFNGSSGNENPAGYFGKDGWHTNQEGAALIAQLHRDLGYAPFTP